MPMSSSHTYRIVEVVGTSPTGINDAIESGIANTAESIQHVDWFEVREIRGEVENGKIAWYQVKMGVGFRVGD